MPRGEKQDRVGHDAIGIAMRERDMLLGGFDAPNGMWRGSSGLLLLGNSDRPRYDVSHRSSRRAALYSIPKETLPDLDGDEVGMSNASDAPGDVRRPALAYCRLHYGRGLAARLPHRALFRGPQVFQGARRTIYGGATGF
jgi:hypothetical protein